MDYTGMATLIASIGTLITILVSNYMQLRAMKKDSAKNKIEIKADIDDLAVAVDNTMQATAGRRNYSPTVEKEK